MTASQLENFDRDWEMTVFPHPKAPGTAQVPPWENSVKNILSSQKANFTWKLVCGWSRFTDRPLVVHFQVDVASAHCVLDNHEHFLDGVSAASGYALDFSRDVWWNENLVFGNDIIFENDSDHVTSGNLVTNLTKQTKIKSRNPRGKNF